MVKSGAGLAIAAAALALSAAGPAPRAVAQGDFDGDGKIDRAELHVAPGGYEIALLLGGQSYAAPVIVDRGPPQLAGDALETVAPGRFVGSAAAPPRIVPERIETQYEGLSFSSSAGMVRLIYWTGSNFRAVWLKP
jgi:hypothetical protein